MNDVFFKCDATGCQVQYRNADQRFKFYDIDNNQSSYCLAHATNFGIPLGEESTFKDYPQIVIDVEDGERLFRLTDIQIISSLTPQPYEPAKESDDLPQETITSLEESENSGLDVPDLMPGGLNVLVLCESGQVTSVMLAHRLSDLYPGNTYHTASIHSNFAAENYDLLVTLPYLLDRYSAKIQGDKKIIAVSNRIFLSQDKSHLFAIMDRTINLLGHKNDLDKEDLAYLESSLEIFDLFDMKRRREPDPLSEKFLLLPHGTDPDAEVKKRQERLEKEWKPKSNIRPKKT